MPRAGKAARIPHRTIDKPQPLTEKEHSTMNITNVTVHRNSEYADYSISWEFKGSRYHIWMSGDEHAVRPTLYKNTLDHNLKRGDPGYLPTRQLNVTVPKNKLMIDDAIAEAVAAQLFEAADQKLKDEAAAKAIEYAAARKLKDAEAAAPEMLKVLKAIAEFWSGEQTSFPLSPGALILPAGSFYSNRDGEAQIIGKTGGGLVNPDDHETIADAVRRVVLFAETGGRVEL
jgi:hypothetical protein